MKLKLLFCDADGNIFEHPYLEASGMKGGLFFKLKRSDLIKLPSESRLFMTPQRSAVGFAKNFDKPVVLAENGVAAFIPPGCTATFSASYKESGKPKDLPLFSYCAVGACGKDLYAAAVRIDKERRHDLRFMGIEKVKKGIAKVRKLYPKNRLIRHLEKCALVYCCPGARNFFLGRYECPLPSSPSCNARCFGCISFQPGKRCSSSQNRITFMPTPEELAEAALYHLENVKDPVLSYGQGCEGEPLLASSVIEGSIKIIRKHTTRGLINMNTNGSKPEILKKLFDAGLDSIRVSMNSAREIYYNRYYKPKGYAFSDIIRSVRLAKENNKFVSINYLTMPGFTDSKKEFLAFEKMLSKTRPDMIQWRNMNIDPISYFREIGYWPRQKELIGISEVLRKVKRDFPKLMMGYFNPSKGRIRKTTFLSTASQRL